MSRWVSMICDEEAETLLSRHPNAFLLLAQIAMRAKWKDCPITNLKKGEAWIGDFKAAGLKTPKAYRHAQKVLEKCGLAAFKGANKGTVATLTNSDVFSLSPPARGEQMDNQGASKGQPEGEQGATNKTDRRNDGPNRTEDLFPQNAAAPSNSRNSWKHPLAEPLWKSAPQRSRQRSSRKDLEKALSAIPRDELPSEGELLEALEKWKADFEWIKEDGEFIPGIHKWVKDRKWEVAPEFTAAKIIPDTPEMLIIGGLFGRNPVAAWTREEFELFAKAAPDSAEIRIIESFYAVPADALPPRYSRRSSLAMLLRYWPQAVDEARTLFADHRELYKPVTHPTAA